MDGHSHVKWAMKPASDLQEDDTDLAVADPLADETLDLWNSIARRNPEIFTEIFQPVPTNLVGTYLHTRFVRGHARF